MKIVIIGAGTVGQGMRKIFPEARFYDPYRNDDYCPTFLRGTNEVNEYDFAIICVPTPTEVAGYSCDTSIVEEVLEWLEVPLILIKSTVPPGFTDSMRVKYDKHICFSPEYMGESSYYTPPWKYPDPENPRSHSWLTIGGDRKDTSRIVDIFAEKLGPDCHYYQTDAKTAELAKLMENTFFATKVTFCNEWYQIAQAFGVDYNELREVWLADPRINRMHTMVFPNKRGFDGKCLPKDLRATIVAASKAGYPPRLLREVLCVNNLIRSAAGLDGV